MAEKALALVVALAVFVFWLIRKGEQAGRAKALNEKVDANEKAKQARDRIDGLDDDQLDDELRKYQRK